MTRETASGVKFATGTYTGNDNGAAQTQTIHVGFAPKVVLIHLVKTDRVTFGILSPEGVTVSGAAGSSESGLNLLTQDGFTMKRVDGEYGLNVSGWLYFYVAFG